MPKAQLRAPDTRNRSMRQFHGSLLCPCHRRPPRPAKILQHHLHVSTSSPCAIPWPAEYLVSFHSPLMNPQFSNRSFSIASSSSYTSPSFSPRYAEYDSGLFFSHVGPRHSLCPCCQQNSRHDSRYDSAISGGSRESKNTVGRIACEWEGCNAPFSRKANVARHKRSTHQIILIDCDVKNCEWKGENGFARRDHLLEHKGGFH